MRNSNLHKIPANFNLKKRGFPFKVYLRKEKDIYKCTIDKYTMVYSFFDEKEVIIDGIDKEYTVKDNDHLVLTINCSNKGLIITSASLSIKSGDFQTEPQTEDCFPGDGYYTAGGTIGMPKCLKSRNIEIAFFGEYTINNEKVIIVDQKVSKHITRYGPGDGWNQL
jgi:hypothetical protein